MANEILIEALVAAKRRYSAWQDDVEDTLKGARRTIWFIQGLNIATYVLGFGLIIFAAVHAARAIVPQEAVQGLIAPKPSSDRPAQGSPAKSGTPAEEAKSARTTSPDKSTQEGPAESSAPATESKIEKTETSEKLENLPQGVVFPNSLKDKIRYDTERKVLILKGVMSEEEKKILLTLSQDGRYKKAVKALFKRSQEKTPPEVKGKGEKTGLELDKVTGELKKAAMTSGASAFSGILIIFLNFFLVKPGNRIQKVYTDIVQMKMAYKSYGVAMENIEKALLLNPLDSGGSNKLLDELNKITEKMVDIIERTAEPKEVEEEIVEKLKDRMSKNLQGMVDKLLPPAESPAGGAGSTQQVEQKEGDTGKKPGKTDKKT